MLDIRFATKVRFPVQWSLLVLVWVVFGVSGEAAVKAVGPGGYLTTRPQPCKALPNRIYRTADITGPVPTGQWWSSLLWEQFSSPMFAHPLAMTCGESGLAVVQHGAEIRADKVAIYGSGNAKEGDFVIGLSTVEQFSQAEYGGGSDWFISAVFSDGAETLRTTFGHGSPFVFCENSGGRAQVTFRKNAKKWGEAGEGSVLGLSLDGRVYGLFGPSGTRWEQAGDHRWLNVGGEGNYFSVAVLPDNDPKTLKLFGRYAHSHVTDTRVEFEVKDGFLNTSYHFVTDPFEGNELGTIYSLYPHQWKYCSDPLAGKIYNSVRGVMKVGVGDQFVTRVPVHGVLPMLPGITGIDSVRMRGYLRSELKRLGGADRDTYAEGKLLGKLASLSGVAQSMGEPEMQGQFVGEIKRRLEGWFSAVAGKDRQVFYYDSTWGTLIGSRPSYGSDHPLNDHHFHYGYFIRAAAEVARTDREWGARWAPMVNLLIRDIASPDREDPLFPYLRSFDRYAGHSWASGNAKFWDGNNQESSSEAMNAWYGMILWGEVMGDRSVRDTGLFLFNTERVAVEEYWFDVDGSNFPSTFPNEALGMVWGGKGAYATWFSGDSDHIHGINWLPFTPASLYLGRTPDYVARSHSKVMDSRKSGNDLNAGWGDLVCMYQALFDPVAAAAYMDANLNCKVEAGNTRAFMYHWLQTLKALGTVEANVTADHPLAMVFSRDGRRKYVAYNATTAVLTVTFSDRTTLTVKPGQLAVR